MTGPEVSGLTIYPIKGTAPTNLEEATFTERGIQYDREWIVCSPEGSFMSQRKEPQLAVVKADITNGDLVVNAPGMETLVVDLETQGEERTVDFFNKAGTGIVQGAEAAEWFSDFLGKDAELLRVAQPREVKEECQVEGAATSVGFADAFPSLIVNEASLAELNGHLEQEIPIDRFRGNIVVSGEQLDAYDEDYWREIKIGSLRMFIVRACARCPVPNTDQQTGIRTDREVTTALRQTRHGIDLVNGKPGDFFGQNAIHVFEPGTTIRVGDTVEVVERSDERNFEPAKK